MSVTSDRAAESWIDFVCPGDVIQFRSGALRTALDVKRGPDGRVKAVSFAILHCSWTTRGHTVLSRTDLVGRVDSLTRARVDLSSNTLAQRLIADMRAPGPPTDVHCCDVTGVFE